MSFSAPHRVLQQRHNYILSIYHFEIKTNTICIKAAIDHMEYVVKIHSAVSELLVAVSSSSDLLCTLDTPGRC